VTARASVALCTVAPIDRTEPDGFAMRATCIALALSAVFDVTIVDVVAPGDPPLAHEPLVLDAAAGRERVELAGDLRRHVPRQGAVGAIGRPLHTALGLASGRPDWQFGMTGGRATTAAVTRSALDAHDLVVLPYHLAHVALALAANTRSVVFLEEGVERRIAATPPRRGVVTAAHRALRRHGAEALYRKVGARGDSIVVVSEGERLHFSSYVPPERLHIVPSTVDPALLDFPLAVLNGAPPITVLVSGLFDKSQHAYSGLRTLLLGADAQLRTLGRTPHWLLAGRGAAALELADIEWEAWSGDHVADAYGHADVVIVPGRTAVGVRSTFLQGLAAGRPTVATWDTLWTAGAEPSRHAFSASGPEQLPAALADAVRSGDLAGVAAAGRQLFQERYSWAVVGRAAVGACTAALSAA
jgi:glycosyltransferase involved in cell wall biosynthesis